MKALSLFCSLLIIGCSHKETENQYLVPSAVEASSCLAQLQSAKRETTYKVFDVVKNGVETGASYVLTGAGYTADFVVVLIGGVGAGVIICSPIIALEGGLAGGGHASGECIGGVASSIGSYFPEDGLGKSLYQGTEELRCPEIDYISKALRRVFQCYQDRGQIEKARLQAKKLLSDPLLKKCSSSGERNEVEKLGKIL